MNENELPQRAAETAAPSLPACASCWWTEEQTGESVGSLGGRLLSWAPDSLLPESKLEGLRPRGQQHPVPDSLRGDHPTGSTRCVMEGKWGPFSHL